MATNQDSDEMNKIVRNAAQELQQINSPKADTVKPSHVETGSTEETIPRPNGEKALRQAKKLSVMATRSGSRHFVTLTVLDAVEGGIGIPGYIVRVMREDFDPPVADLEKTNALGVTNAEYELGNLQGAQIKFIVLGTDVTGRILLRRGA